MTAVKLTLEEFLAQPETKPYSEFASGQAFQKPFADVSHAAIQAFFCAMLYQFLAHGGLGRAFIDHSPATWKPRLIWPSRSFRRTSTCRSSWTRSKFYLLYGVRMVWVIDPETHTISVQTPGNEGQILSEGDTLDGGEVLPGFQVTVNEIFAQMPVSA